MNNDKNAIPKPLNVQVRELTIALELALKKVNDYRVRLERADNENDDLQLKCEDLEENRNYWKNNALNLRKERDRIMGDCLEMNDKLRRLEERFNGGQIDIPPPGLQPFEYRAPARPPAPLPYGRDVHVRRAMEVGAEQMGAMERLIREREAYDQARLQERLNAVAPAAWQQMADDVGREMEEWQRGLGVPVPIPPPAPAVRAEPANIMYVGDIDPEPEQDPEDAVWPRR